MYKEIVMKVKNTILAGLLFSTALLPVQAVNVNIPGADSSLPNTIYNKNIVNQTALDRAVKDGNTYLSALKTTQLPEESRIDILTLAAETVRAANYHSSLFILNDADRHITFTIPKNSIEGLVMPKSKDYTQFINTHNGHIGIEVTPITDLNTWNTTGKAYKDITKEDMKVAFTKHNPAPGDAFVDGGKFSYKGLSNGTWDVATMKTEEGTDTISTINFSLADQPNYMYHIGIINDTTNPDYKKDLALLANYTIPSIKSSSVSKLSTITTDMNPFTVTVMKDLKEVKNTFQPKTGGIKKFNGESISHIILSDPIPEGFTGEEVFYYALKRMLTMPMFSTQNDNQYYAVWHNETPGFIIDFKGLNGNPSTLTYVIHNNESMLISTLIYDPNKISASHEELLQYISHVDIAPDKNIHIGITRLLPEIEL